MSTFAIFNYQFDKIMEHARQGELKGMETVLMPADEAFPQKQKIFGDILKNDFKKGKSIDVIHFTNGHGREKQVDDYQNCIVMIDNRPGIQRMLIENKKTAFRDVKSLAAILQYTFNQLLRRYSLTISLDHLQDSRQFWQYANDLRAYPTGFYRICFKLPYPNLDRLRKVFDRLFSQAQKSFDSRLNMDFINPEGKVRLDENDPYQKEAIKWFMEEAGGDVTLYSNLAKKTPIHVGENSYRAITVSNTIIQKVTEDAVNNDLFGSSALDEVKRKLKTGIEP